MSDKCFNVISGGGETCFSLYTTFGETCFSIEVDEIIPEEEIDPEFPDYPKPPGADWRFLGISTNNMTLTAIIAKIEYSRVKYMLCDMTVMTTPGDPQPLFGIDRFWDYFERADDGNVTGGMMKGFKKGAKYLTFVDSNVYYEATGLVIDTMFLDAWTCDYHDLYKSFYNENHIFTTSTRASCGGQYERMIKTIPGCGGLWNGTSWRVTASGFNVVAMMGLYESKDDGLIGVTRYEEGKFIILKDAYQRTDTNGCATGWDGDSVGLINHSSGLLSAVKIEIEGDTFAIGFTDGRSYYYSLSEIGESTEVNPLFVLANDRDWTLSGARAILTISGDRQNLIQVEF